MNGRKVGVWDMTYLIYIFYYSQLIYTHTHSHNSPINIVTNAFIPCTLTARLSKVTISLSKGEDHRPYTSYIQIKSSDFVNRYMRPPTPFIKNLVPEDQTKERTVLQPPCARDSGE